MPVRSIVTFVEPSEVDRQPSALSTALDWARSLDARLVVLAFPINVTGPSVQETDVAVTRSAIAAVADRAGVPATVVDRSSFAYGIGEVFADHMKVADLGILSGQTGPLTGVRLLAEAALFDSGRPLVVVPRNAPHLPLPRRALIAWDGTHAAARAMQDALSLLAYGTAALVARVTDDKALRMDQSGIEAAHHLARHGLKAEFREIPRDGRDIYDALAAAARESGCDLIVAGAVRHSPLRELIFGSVTRKVLSGDGDLPVLLSA
ncbi:MAG: universal stress protein [Tabrizicola sp.]|nr:universal stress protein [Tabrizicola sp.]